MPAMAVQFQANLNATFKPWPPQTHFHNYKSIPTSTSAKPRTLFPSLNLRELKLGYSSRKFELRASAVAADPAVFEEAPVDESAKTEIPPEAELGVIVKPLEKPRLVLKFIWMEKNIGIALDQTIPGHGTIPLSPYYFWPRKDAWEELKVLLESKPWISQKQMIILLNQATDIINLWQQSGGNLS
ncbi:small ribosomal subunit protein cS23-like isoform X2 [Humulus lupulus]|uniref:small ribosomal subunit protein cS23-like isoform X2 n=1 Tax=Humulus lupulus TaxID=3486 RepID=UPI002B40CF71|nr:small ribosomal subunit protein cS23-like isoform X2 [Humulus lupulus]